ncbi:uncharacterized protein LOC122509082 [Leptopilina heterotoma]|uniref:uncharacterized protein LOC122509082 n=1 Tax=Leptopilina heterotoma TaxID=63436 RepID=UPI001CA9F3A1|nr:uncharacterized protein LOC122509082 [Leptopilina heterotoma]
MNCYTDGEYDWKKLVRLTLLEIYGAEITKYSATGKSVNSRPPINYRLFQALFEWAKSLLNDGVNLTKADYINLINKVASNKRKYEKKQEQSIKKVKLSEERFIKANTFQHQHQSDEKSPQQRQQHQQETRPFIQP